MELLEGKVKFVKSSSISSMSSSEVSSLTSFSSWLIRYMAELYCISYSILAICLKSSVMQVMETKGVAQFYDADVSVIIPVANLILPINTGIISFAQVYNPLQPLFGYLSNP